MKARPSVLGDLLKERTVLSLGGQEHPTDWDRPCKRASDVFLAGAHHIEVIRTRVGNGAVSRADELGLR